MERIQQRRRRREAKLPNEDFGSFSREEVWEAAQETAALIKKLGLVPGPLAPEVDEQEVASPEARKDWEAIREAGEAEAAVPADALNIPEEVGDIPMPEGLGGRASRRSNHLLRDTVIGGFFEARTGRGTVRWNKDEGDLLMNRYRIWAVWIFLTILLGGCGQNLDMPPTENPTTTVLPNPTLTETIAIDDGEATGTSTETEIPAGAATDVTTTPTKEAVTPGKGEVTPPEDIQVVRLTFNEKWGDYDPVWSPDGDRLLFTSRRVQESGSVRARDLFIMNLDGSGQRRLTDTTGGVERILGEGAWSPNGIQIAVAIRHGNGAGLATIKIYTFPLIREGFAPVSFEDMELLIDFGEAFAVSDPAWSPDGDKLAFKYSDLRLLDEERGSTIALFEFESGEITEITNGNDMYSFDLSWAPNNETIAFAADLLDGNEEIKFYIFLVEVNSGQITQMTFNGEEKQQAWSPDGHWIVFTSEEYIRHSLYLIHVDSGKIYKLIENTVKDNYYDSPSWSPDGKWIAFSAPMGNEHSDIYLLDMSWLEMDW